MMSVVIIPAYRPDETLAQLAGRLWLYGCRIVVVDDGSGEAYRSIFSEIGELCTVLRHSENRGKGAAIKTALSYIRENLPDCDVIGIMDADGQHLPEDMMRLIKWAFERKNTLMLGVRAVGSRMPLRSRLGNRITRTVFRLLSGVKISDTQSGLRAFRRELLEKILEVGGERYEYEMNMLMSLAKDGVPIEEVCVDTIYRDRKNSTSHFRTVRDSVRIYRGLFKFSLSSLSSFVLDYLLFSAFLFFVPRTGISVVLANVAARFISAFYNYSMNCRFVFHTHRRFRTAAHYFALAGFLLIVNNAILTTFVQSFHMSVYPAKLLTEGVLFLLSWIVQKQMIFRKRDFPV